MMRKLIVAITAAATLSVTLSAFADGPVSAYNGEQDLALSPNERVVSESLANDDGAVEDPQHPMTGTARAFRNGLINGRALQKADDAKALPPLPPYPPKSYASYPAAAQVQTIPTQAPVRQYAPQPAPQYAQAYDPSYQPYAPRLQPPMAPRVMQPPPQYYQPAYYGPEDVYADEEPQEQYTTVYASPPRPVYVPRPVPVYMPPPIVIRGYVPHYAQPYPRYYAGAYGGYVGYNGRGYRVNSGW